MIDEKKLIMAIANWQMTLKPGWSSANDTDTVTYNTLEEVVGLIEDQPTIQPYGYNKDGLIEEMERVFDKFSMMWNGCFGSAVQEVINQQPTTDVPDTNVGEIPQLYKDRVEHVIKVLESCKQRHIDIVTDLPHTVEMERGTISAYSVALKVVRECLLQPYKESE